MPGRTINRNPYLLVFRDSSPRGRDPLTPRQMGKLLHEWLLWHDRLELQGVVRFRSSIDSKSRSVSEPSGALACGHHFEQGDPIVGYLLIDAASFDEATEIARGCPGLEYGFAVEVYRSHEIGGSAHCESAAS